MKIAVYTIALNEAKHVERWYESAKEADYLLICDTGSTDDTVDIARSLGIKVVEISIKPWRFDDARNYALMSLPLDVDYCISMDMDEMLTPGWREELQKAYDAGNGGQLPRPKHKLVTDFDAQGNPTVDFYANRIHTRFNYRWRHPIHEVIVPYGSDFKEWFFEIGLKIYHRPDNTKSRGQYLPMLEMAVDEEPYSARNLYYYARELFFTKQYLEAKLVFEEYLKYTKYPGEKAYALRYLAKCDPSNAERHLKESIKTLYCREGVLALANHYYITKEWKKCLKASLEAMEIKEKLNDFMSEEWAYGHMAYDLTAISAWQLEQWDDALRYGEMALERSPDDERLQNNVKFYRSKVDELHVRSDGG